MLIMRDALRQNHPRPTMIRRKIPLLLIALAALFAGCAENRTIVNNLEERDANEIVVFLASRGINATKVTAPAAETGGAKALLFNIAVPEDKTLDAMALLNSNGLPRRRAETLLQLFAKKGLMTSDREETIRYQAGVEDQLKNIICKIDGVLDAEVQISFPKTENIIGAETTPPKIKAAVYVKHQGVFDNPNNHLETKIKRLLAGSIENLEFDNISVIADRSRLAEAGIQDKTELFQDREDQFIRIWSITISKASAARFRSLFFLLIALILGVGGAAGFLIYKFYPQLIKKPERKEKEE